MRGARRVVLLGAALLAGANRPATAQAATEARDPARGPLRTALSVGGGALVGGFMGYFVSQVGTSDWENLRAEEKSSMRRRFTVSGAALGAVAGLLLRPRVNHDPFEARAQLVAPRTGRLLIGAEELRRSVATNALEVIQLERPEWLRTRLVADTTASLASAVPSALVVYVGEERLGEVERLRDVAVPEVRELRYYDARDARRRWRSEHPYGAIEVVPIR